jgi:hypothetical protein
MILVSCPNCLEKMRAPARAAGLEVFCPSCGQPLRIPPSAPAQGTGPGDRWAQNQPAAPEAEGAETRPREASYRTDVPPAPRRRYDEERDRDRDRGGASSVAGDTAPVDVPAGRPHSGLGIASFLIALLVLGMDMILGVVIAANIAGSRAAHGADLLAGVVAGGMGLVLLNCVSVPVCLVGLGLAVVGLVAHRAHNHLFTWLGLFGNGVVVFGLVCLFLLGGMTPSPSPPSPGVPPPPVLPPGDPPRFPPPKDPPRFPPPKDPPKFGAALPLSARDNGAALKLTTPCPCCTLISLTRFRQESASPVVPVASRTCCCACCGAGRVRSGSRLTVPARSCNCAAPYLAIVNRGSIPCQASSCALLCMISRAREPENPRRQRGIRFPALRPRVGVIHPCVEHSDPAHVGHWQVAGPITAPSRWCCR